ncbi:MAG: DUF808 domain-containing protein [Deltaproteobacteria bacterium]|nr:DUF808 domain-containing protein [Deltaproteobacteria bacterium]
MSYAAVATLDNVSDLTLFTLLDDLAVMLDDVAMMTKAATQKTAGVLGDDLALNAEQVAGVAPNRELPVVWAVTKGSALNKAILVPAALAISAIAPWIVTPLLMLGGTYLCFEGFEKVTHKWLAPKQSDEARRAALALALQAQQLDVVAFEKEKIRGALRTDFILSAEIIVIVLGTVAAASFVKRLMVLVAIAVITTVGVYGLVALIVKLDDVGLALSKKSGIRAALGRALVRLAPWLMKSLSLFGTLAMFLVGGGIIAHGIPGLDPRIASLTASAAALPVAGSVLASLLPSALQGLVGLLTGALALALVAPIKNFVRKRKRRSEEATTRHDSPQS